MTGDLFTNKIQPRDCLDAEIISFKLGDVIVPARMELDRSCIQIDGMAAHAHDIGDRPGEQVISALYVAGDFVDLHGFVLKRLQHDIVAMGPCTVQFVPHADLEKITQKCPGLTFDLAHDSDRCIDPPAVVGRGGILAFDPTPRTSAMRVVYRYGDCRRLQDLEVFTPRLQRDVATISGYSSIHTNRSVRDLRDRGPIKWSQNKIEILDWDGLAKFAHFDPEYLELEKRPR